MGVIANHGRFSRGVAISSFTGNIISYEMVHLSGAFLCDLIFLLLVFWQQTLC
jgi:hypothetical protein